MDKATKRKRNWTIESALCWIADVNNGKEKHGLKYCSALDFLKSHMPK